MDVSMVFLAATEGMPAFLMNGVLGAGLGMGLAAIGVAIVRGEKKQTRRLYRTRSNNDNPGSMFKLCFCVIGLIDEGSCPPGLIKNNSSHRDIEVDFTQTRCLSA